MNPPDIPNHVMFVQRQYWRRRRNDATRRPVERGVSFATTLSPPSKVASRHPRKMKRLERTAVVLLVPSYVMAFARWGPHLPTSLTSPAAAASLQRRTSLDSATVSLDGDCVTTKDVFSLERIRSSLIRQEETIIFALIERAQFRENAIVYERGGFGCLGTPVGSTPVENGEELSFLEYMLVGTEALHCGVRRYTSPEEHAFFPERLPNGPMQALPSLQFPQDLLSPVGGANHVNFNKRLLRKYVDIIVPSVAKKGDDEQHGSTVLCDIAVLQALSRRVHYGKFVAESKYRSDPDEYQRLVDAGDAEGVMRLLTNEVVEEQVLRRARLKAATYGSEPLLAELPPITHSDTASIVAQAAASAVVAALEAMDEEKSETKVDPRIIESVYRDIIIPMTKDIEVSYLFRRCGRDPPPQYRE